jgi:hypothetical protein
MPKADGIAPGRLALTAKQLLPNPKSAAARHRDIFGAIAATESLDAARGQGFAPFWRAFIIPAGKRVAGFLDGIRRISAL